MSVSTTRTGKIIQDPPFVQKLLSDTRAGWIFFLLRVWLGWQWVQAAEHKITSAAWMVNGSALKGYWANAVKVTDPAHPTIAFGWYRDFLQMMLNTNAYVWFAKIVAVGELLVGIALILGAFTGIAAFFGAFMNWNYIMAGSASTNPLLLVAAIAIILGWKVAGYVGADYFLLKWLGTPWQAAEPSDKKVTQPKPASTPAD